ncbi:hypothetical protein E2C01_080930 [Portunus trituberculatus]|uniref:Uncharacterized protein n=1 Tax=Portunus trituberculatus TaxID=210409 RepID=A0A5B7J0W9_PORTR|nr:hypothetical protein [Portunus trituberculatus]
MGWGGAERILRESKDPCATRSGLVAVVVMMVVVCSTCGTGEWEGEERTRAVITCCYQTPPPPSQLRPAHTTFVPPHRANPSTPTLSLYTINTTQHNIPIPIPSHHHHHHQYSTGKS